MSDPGRDGLSELQGIVEAAARRLAELRRERDELSDRVELLAAEVESLSQRAGRLEDAARSHEQEAEALRRYAEEREAIRNRLARLQRRLEEVLRPAEASSQAGVDAAPAEASATRERADADR